MDGGWGGQQDTMRCAQADRDRCADVLKAAWAEGRLKDDEYRHRLGLALSAETYGQLTVLVHDLPVGPVPSAARPVAAAPVHPYTFVAPHAYLPPMTPRPMPPQTNGLAVTALVLGIVTLVAVWPATALLTIGYAVNPYPFVFAGVAVVTGHVGLHQSRTRPYPYNGGSGIAVAGLTLGWIQLALALLVELGRN
ncbi:DUF1707 and DUF4190 domain-containing protein [Streptodolium elevatio]|uniref:DUF1707 and DUF4190 domain-containing protein n=1 Tax=Streptodolium elevatio TaxID=3157996 RepID=A0ABV3DTQ2_9ACTN